MKKLVIPIAIVIAVISALVIVGLTIKISPTLGADDSPEFPALRRGSIALIRIEGGIYDSREAIRQIHKYRDKRNIRAILIRIESPGGGVAASYEIYRELTKVRDNYGKPIVVSMGSVAASGGYYIATAADWIVANPGTVTGSIGVIMYLRNVEDLYEKIGVKARTIKSGEFKDSGSPFRDMTQEEKTLFQGIVDDMYEQFVEVVVKGRNMDEEKVRSLADGRILSGRQAFQAGLVDELGNLQDAIKATTKIAGIKGKPKIIFEKKRGFSIWDLVLGSSRDLLTSLDHPGGIISFEYRMAP